MIKAVIFDMDGTMVDTEKLWVEVNTQLAAQYGGVYDEIIKRDMTGRKEDEALTLFQKYFKIPVEVPELQKIRNEMLMKLMDRVVVNPGLYEFIALLDAIKMKKAIATSTYRTFAGPVIDKIKLTDAFSIFITGDEITKGKPDPEMYLKAAAMLGVAPQECLVIEDAENGVMSAINAGMKVIAIPHEHTHNHNFSKATRVMSSMLDIDKRLLSSL